MRDAILARAADYAYSRVICGVHYPSDGNASKLAAYSMMSILVNNPQFKQELDAARVEIRNAINP
jgi:acid phosphatase (class A)